MSGFLRHALTALLPLMLATGCTRQPAEKPFTVKQVGANVWAAIDNPKAASPAFANAGFVIGEDGVVVIDTLSNADAARQLLAEIRTRTRLPVRFVINTHYHEDHVAGNATFADAGAAIVAQRNVRRWIHSENLRLLGPKIAPDQRARTEALVAPAIVFDRELDRHLDRREVQVQSFPGHTGGDSIVVIPDSKTIFVGDLFFHDMFPTLIDASLTPLIDTLETLVARYDAGYTFVPGHGDPGKATDVAAFRDYLKTVRTLVSEARRQGKSGEAVAAAVVPALKATYGHWEFFDQAAKENVLQVDADVTGTKRVPR